MLNFIPPKDKYEILHGGFGGGGNYLELITGSTSISRKINANSSKTYFIYDPSINSWKFQYCRIPVTNQWLLNQIVNQVNFITFENDILQNSNLSEEKFDVKLFSNLHVGREIPVYLITLR